MKILVTGGYGFIGTNLCLWLKDAGHEVVVLDNLSSSVVEDISGVPCVMGDISDPHVTDMVVPGCEAVVHLAAIAGVVECQKDPQRAWKVNAGGTLNLLESCHKSGVSKFVMASSTAVTGDAELPVNESVVPHPTNQYGASKLAAEALCEAYKYMGVETTSFRFTNVYGPHFGKKNSVIPSFIRNLYAQKPLEVHGKGNQTRDFIYVGDVCRAILCGLLSPKIGVYQLGTGVETSMLKLVTMLSNIAGDVRIKIKYLPPRYENTEKRSVADISKIKQDMGWEPLVDLNTGLKETWEWYKNA